MWSTKQVNFHFVWNNGGAWYSKNQIKFPRQIIQEKSGIQINYLFKQKKHQSIFNTISMPFTSNILIRFTKKSYSIRFPSKTQTILISFYIFQIFSWKKNLLIPIMIMFYFLQLFIKLRWKKNYKIFSCEFHSRFHLCVSRHAKKYQNIYEEIAELNGGFLRDWFGMRLDGFGKFFVDFILCTSLVVGRWRRLVFYTLKLFNLKFIKFWGILLSLKIVSILKMGNWNFSNPMFLYFSPIPCLIPSNFAKETIYFWATVDFLFNIFPEKIKFLKKKMAELKN